MRRKIFISHAKPEDNVFATWLYLKLSSLGYDVWCELESLRAGAYFWDEIDTIIRHGTAKFLFVASHASAVKRGGIYDEFDFARTIATDNNLERFIFILKIDDAPDNSRIGQHRINSINFENSWATGLKTLLDELEHDNIPKGDVNYDNTAQLWRNIINNQFRVIQKEELYSSNWFPLTQMPATLNFHKFDVHVPDNTPLWKYKYPAKRFKDYLATFAGCYDFQDEFPKTLIYDAENSVQIPVHEILNGEYNTEFISNRDAKVLLQVLFNKAFNQHLNGSGLWKYKMASNKLAFWYPKDSLEKDKVKGIKLVGRLKRGTDSYINWHFGVSGASRLLPAPLYVIKSHIFFTENGKRLLSSASIQHKARRKQGKNWWNKQWREKLLHALIPISDENHLIQIPVGEHTRLVFSALPISFHSPVTYVDPNDEYLLDEVVAAEHDNIEDEDFQALNDHDENVNEESD